MSHLSASETCTRVASELGRTASPVRELNLNFIAHEMTFIIFCDTLFGGFATIKFLDTNMGKFREAWGKWRYIPRSHSQPYTRISATYVQTKMIHTSIQC